MESPEPEVVKGETVKFIKEYDLYDLQLKGLNGILCRATEYNKYLIYVPDNEEWCEVSPDYVRRVRPGYVSKKNKKFSDLVKQLVYSFET